MNDNELIEQAIRARELAYAPYSNFMVGAALLTKDGKVYKGCNIENAGYSPSNCAERTAFFKAVSEGDLHFEAIAVAGWAKGANNNNPAFPCGVCRQVMMEFCDPKTFRVLITDSQNNVVARTLEELLPHGFGPADLPNDQT